MHSQTYFGQHCESLKTVFIFKPHKNAFSDAQTKSFQEQTIERARKYHFLSGTKSSVCLRARFLLHRLRRISSDGRKKEKKEEKNENFTN